jgi:hypothetical protein
MLRKYSERRAQAPAFDWICLLHHYFDFEAENDDKDEDEQLDEDAVEEEYHAMAEKDEIALSPRLISPTTSGLPCGRPGPNWSLTARGPAITTLTSLECTYTTTFTATAPRRSLRTL